MLEVEFNVVATAGNGQRALECIERYQPDVAVLDLEMPILNGIAVTRELMKLGLHPAVVICSMESDPDRTPEEQATSPWSDAVLVGDTLYVSGDVGAHPKTGVVPASPEEETRLVMDDIKHILEAAGMSMDDLVQVNVLCTDLSLFKNFNSVYRTYFHKGFPARSLSSKEIFL